MKPHHVLFLAQASLFVGFVFILDRAAGGEDPSAATNLEFQSVLRDDSFVQEKGKDKKDNKKDKDADKDGKKDHKKDKNSDKDKKDKNSDKDKKDKNSDKDKKDKNSDKDKKDKNSDKDKKDKNSDKDKKDKNSDKDRKDKNSDKDKKDKKDKDDKDHKKDYGSLKYFDLKVGGQEREALIAYPHLAGKGNKDKQGKDKDKAAPAPVIFIFHGHGETMRIAADAFGVHKHWDDAICVYMQGVKTVRPSDKKGEYTGWKTDGERDVLFFDAVLANLKKHHSIDDKRIFITGFSNGAAFTYYVWAKRGPVIRAVAPCAGAYKGSPLSPKPYLHIAGRRDDIIDFDNQVETIDRIRNWNGCSDKGVDWPKNKSALDGKMFSSSKGAPIVRVIHAGDHIVPGGTGALIAQFFKEIAKK